MSWASFSGDQVAALTRGQSFFADPGERVCPACGGHHLRAYVTTPPRRPGNRDETAPGGRPTLVTYAWCGACRRFVGTRSRHPEGLVFADPLAALTEAERRDLERSLVGFLEHLDRLWDDGVLPQTFAA